MFLEINSEKKKQIFWVISGKFDEYTKRKLLKNAAVLKVSYNHYKKLDKRALKFLPLV